MTELQREPLASVDAAWLRMDEPGNLMVVNAVMMLDAPIPFEQFRDLIASRLVASVPRLRQRIAHPLLPFGPLAWELDPHFDISNHVRLAPLEHPDQASLQDLVGRLMAEPFDPARPPWMYYFVPRYEGGCATIARFHHCIGDGLAMLYLLLQTTDKAPAVQNRRASPHTARSAWDAILAPISRGWSLTRQVEQAVLHEVGEILAHPARALDATRDLSTAAGALGKLLLMGADPHTVFKGPLSAAKRAVWSQPVPLATIRELAHVTGSTINDVVLASVAGALRRYLISRGQPAESLNLRAVVPVNLRAFEDASQLGNRFGLVFVPLPLGIAEPLDRIFEVRGRMRDIKHSPESLLTFQILRMLGSTPSPLFDAVVTLFGLRSTAVMTNVIGPREPLHVAGTTLRQVMFWVPCSGHLGMGVSIFSYAGSLSVGVATDAGLVPDPDRIVHFFHDELQDLLELAAAVRVQRPVEEGVGDEAVVAV